VNTTAGWRGTVPIVPRAHIGVPQEHYTAPS